jgi:hypothetical protein
MKLNIPMARHLACARLRVSAVRAGPVALLLGLAACGGGGGGGGSAATGPKGPLTISTSQVLAGDSVVYQIGLAPGAFGPADIAYKTVQPAPTATGLAMGGPNCATTGTDFISNIGNATVYDGNNSATLTIVTCPNASFKPNNRLDVDFTFEGKTTRVSALIVNTAAGGLNDTGITQCLNSAGALVACTASDLAAPQDGQTGRDVNALSNAAGDGRVGFAFASAGGNCLQDKVTGLYWDKTSAATATLAAAQALPAQANSAARCGRTDWRLPAVDELLSLVDSGAAPGARIDAQFTATPALPSWTATAYAGDTAASWVVDFNSGAAAFETATNPLGKSFAARLVAGAAVVAAACDDAAVTRLVDNHDGTITDLKTGLMWQQCTDGLSGGSCATGTPTAQQNFAAALLRATQVNADAAVNRGYADWRVPNRNELASLVNWNCSAPAIQRSRFPNTPSTSAWSSSPAGAGLVWYVDFTDGNLALSGTTGGRVLRLVRAGQ